MRHVPACVAARMTWLPSKALENLCPPSPIRQPQPARLPRLLSTRQIQRSGLRGCSSPLPRPSCLSPVSPQTTRISAQKWWRFRCQRMETQGSPSQNPSGREQGQLARVMVTARVALVLAASAATARTTVAFGVSSPMARFGRATAVPSFLRGSATASACRNGATALRAQRGSGSEYSEEGVPVLACRSAGWPMRRGILDFANNIEYYSSDE